MSIIQRTVDAFQTKIDKTAAPRLFQAPGRVNLIGEHTDYNAGFVLPAAIDRRVVVAARPRDDDRINVYALDFEESDSFDAREPISHQPHKPWTNYIRGMASTLIQEGSRLAGMDAVIAGNVPIGAGLSSSAAIEVAIGYTLLALAGAPIDRPSLALSAQKAENDFVGMHCGIMDQFISCLGRAGCALLIDCRDLSFHPAPMPSRASIVIVDSGVHRGLMDMEYNARRAECETAAIHFNVPALRDVDEPTFRSRSHELSPVVRRRARHVITENARTLAAAEAMKTNDLPALGRLMTASHQSLREDFEVSAPELDLLVEIALDHDGVYGARLTGAGFGGCIVALVDRDEVDGLTAAIHAHYPEKTGRAPAIYICKASEGVSEIG